MCFHHVVIIPCFLTQAGEDHDSGTESDDEIEDPELPPAGESLPFPPLTLQTHHFHYRTINISANICNCEQLTELQILPFFANADLSATPACNYGFRDWVHDLLCMCNAYYVLRFYTISPKNPIKKYCSDLESHLHSLRVIFFRGENRAFITIPLA